MVALIAAMALVVPSGARAATITVNSESDVVANNGQCALREAITAANTDTPSGSNAGECAAGSGADTIKLPAGFFTLAIAGKGEDANATGDLDLLSDITITGEGPDITTISGEGIDRVFDVTAAHTVSLDGLTVSGGRPENGTNVTAVVGSNGANGNPGAGGGTGVGTNGGPGADGGGIRNAGTLTITNSTITANQAGNGGDGGLGVGGAGGSGTASPSNGGAGGAGIGGIGGTGGSGGGIFNSGALTIRTSTLSGNVAGTGGVGALGVGGSGGAGGGTGSGGAGGAGIGSIGGTGGAGGAIAGSGTIDIATSTIADNASGRGGFADVGVGGGGGTGGASSGPGGGGGTGVGGIGGSGGTGGGISLGGVATIAQTTVARNTTGKGGAASVVVGGSGGTGGSPNGVGGAGGVAVGGIGGSGGAGGAISHGDALTLVNSTISANATGNGGPVDVVVGGTGGHGTGTGNGGGGGVAVGGISGNGGSNSGLAGTGNAVVTHDTVSSNDVGSPGTFGDVFGGSGGAHGSGGGSNGAAGSEFPGIAGSPGAGGGVGSNSKTLTSSIVANNVPANCAGAAATDGGHNITFGDGSCPGTSADPKLGVLADNGGPTETLALRRGSGAIDAAGLGGACPATDQRGVARPAGTACDSGAYEASAPGVAAADATEITTVGAKLNGTVNPNGRATSAHFEFGPTADYGSSTTDQVVGSSVAAGAVSSAITGLTPGTTYHYRIVATNADGTSTSADHTFTTGTNPPPKDTTPPVLSAVSMTNRTFAVSAAPTALSAKKAKRGTAFRYTLSEPATVTITVQKRGKGRKQGTRCVKQTRKNARAKACTRFTRVGVLTRASAAGANTVLFSGRLGTKALKPGRYRAVLLAKDAAGNRSKTASLSFRVVKR
jgi:CSLREA domain-containing protein